MRHKKFDFRTAYIDLLLNVLTGIIFLFVLTTMMIQPKKTEDGPKRNAEFLIVAEWNDESNCDVDLWVQDPLNNIAWFQAKDVGLMHLERDSLGYFNNRILNKDGTVKYQVIENKETTVIRGIVPGEYTVNAHLYGCRNDKSMFFLRQEMNLPVKITLIKLNPSFRSVFTKSVVIKKIWDEETFFNFELDETGNVKQITENYKKLMEIGK